MTSPNQTQNENSSSTSSLLISGGRFRTTANATQPYDVLIRSGRVVDGTGAAWFRADIALRGNTIAAIGKLDGATARRVIDAKLSTA